MLAGCKDDSIPDGLYDYQVIRLLASEESKTWSLVSEESEVCGETYFYVFTNETDSVGVQSISWNCAQEAFSDTVMIGYGKPTSIAMLFTDSLVFDQFSYWRIDHVTANFVDLVQFPDGIQTQCESLD
jgi:hypothetical protein